MRTYYGGVKVIANQPTSPTICDMPSRTQICRVAFVVLS